MARLNFCLFNFQVAVNLEYSGQTCDRIIIKIMIYLYLLSAKRDFFTVYHLMFLNAQYNVHGRKMLKQNVRLQYLDGDGRIILKLS
jgi:hypothetical protein